MLDVLLNENLILPAQNETQIKDEAKLVLVDNFELLLEKDPKLEQKLASIEGLLT